MVRCSSPMGHTPRPRSIWAVSGYWKLPIWTRRWRGRARVPSHAMRRARCASFFSTRTRREQRNSLAAATRRNSVMRKIIVLEHISLDGVIQAPGGPDEDRSDGFAYGGWAAPYHDQDAAIETALNKMLNMPLDLLLGRKTFDIWAAFWPQHGDIWPGANTATKYVVSNTVTSSEWQPSVFLNGDIAEKVAKLKHEQGPVLQVW